MKFRVEWPNATHFLLAGANVELTVGGEKVELTQFTGGAEGEVNPNGDALLTVEFKPSLGGAPAQEVLRIRQRFKLRPGSESLLAERGGAQVTEYLVVRTNHPGEDLPQSGQHPLLHSVSDSGAQSWRVKIDTSVVDITFLQPRLLGKTFALRTEGKKAILRFLARTDGKLPLHYACATPPESTEANATDVLCFLTPPQSSPLPDLDNDEMLLNPEHIDHLAEHVGDFFGTGKHDNTLKVRARDHFTPEPSHPNVVLPRRWEQALMDSGKHVTLVLPIAANGSHNTAASKTLPLQLRQVHNTLVALGDIAAPFNMTPHTPLLGVAAHSNGGPSMFAAIEASAKDAFREIWMFDAIEAAGKVSAVAATGANLLYAGWSNSYVEGPMEAIEKIPALKARTRRLPDPKPVRKAPGPALVTSSPLLAHMLEELVPPGKPWEPRSIPQPKGGSWDERFHVLHQQIVQGNDADGALFLTKALKASAFR